jgi:Carboxymuconolactone decarboxylase family
MSGCLQEDPMPRLRQVPRAEAPPDVQKVYDMQHCKAARSVGVADEKIEALPAWSTSDAFSPVERAVLGYTDELVLQNGRVQDATFERLRAHLGDEEISELTCITARYEMHAIMTRAVRLEYDDVPERVVEVAAPSGARGLDSMGRVGREGR